MYVTQFESYNFDKKLQTTETRMSDCCIIKTLTSLLEALT